MYNKIIYPYVNNQQLLKSVNQLHVWWWILESTPRLYYDKIRNPFRNDSNPGCWLAEYNGAILLVDYGKKYYNIISATKEKYKCSNTEACWKIINEFNITDIKEYSKPTVISNNKTNTDIKIDIREFNSFDKQYWNSYGISIEQLTSDCVFATKAVKLRNRWVKTDKYCYSYIINNKVKLYQPFNKKFKWITNMTNNDIGCLDAIDYTSPILVITKSYKDCRILRNLGYNSIWLQNERCNIPTFLLDIIKHFDKVYILYDNDTTGLEKAKELADKHGFINISYPKNTLQYFKPINEELVIGLKDTADFYIEDKDFLIQYLNTKIWQTEIRVQEQNGN